MGTRADFYIAKENELQWLGSIAWDGYSIAEADEDDISKKDIKKRTEKFLDWSIKNCKDETEFIALINEYLKGRDDGTFPKDGWPWCWDNSNTTDCIYVFKDGRVWKQYYPNDEYESDPELTHFTPATVSLHDDDGEFIEPDEKMTLTMPDMSAIRNPNSDSGFIIIGGL